MNKDERVIKEFGEEWVKYSYNKANKDKLYENYQQYFKIFPWNIINSNSEGFDMGCGSGRWAQFVAPRVGLLNCIEPSEAINVAKNNLNLFKNVNYFKETTENCSIKSDSQDFGYCLGVLHHIPNTEKAIADCSKLLKKGAPFLIYVYYNFENKPIWFKFIWKVSNLFRKIISVLPQSLKKIICEFIAFFIYFPLSKFAFFIDKIGLDSSNVPLSDYRNKPYYHLRNDALDRFGTRLEQRFSKKEIGNMLENNGFEKIIFSENTPYWCCLAYKS
tara:strand:- start:302 stop:1123 length:822 start_codon:yes stop_codon:yes gene_type:complete